MAIRLMGEPWQPAVPQTAAPVLWLREARITEAQAALKPQQRGAVLVLLGHQVPPEAIQPLRQRAPQPEGQRATPVDNPPLANPRKEDKPQVGAPAVCPPGARWVAAPRAAQELRETAAPVVACRARIGAMCRKIPPGILSIGRLVNRIALGVRARIAVSIVRQRRGARARRAVRVRPPALKT